MSACGVSVCMCVCTRGVCNFGTKMHFYYGVPILILKYSMVIQLCILPNMVYTFMQVYYSYTRYHILVSIIAVSPCIINRCKNLLIHMHLSQVFYSIIRPHIYVAPWYGTLYIIVQCIFIVAYRGYHNMFPH